MIARARLTATLPLGIDFGAHRVRVALSERDRRGQARLLAVAAHDTEGDRLSALQRAIADLRSRERRCIFGLTHPDGIVQIARLPAMSYGERLRAARFESMRWVDDSMSNAEVSLHGTKDTERWAIGIARTSAIASCKDAARHVRLHVLAIDEIAFALRRVHPDVDGTVDIGARATRVTFYADPLPSITTLPVGGESFTDAIQQSLGIERSIAEDRKRTIGFAGAGDLERDAFLEAIRDIAASARSGGFPEVRRLAMTGNGSRVPGLPEAVAVATGCDVDLAALRPTVSQKVPPDVLRAAGADWSAAYGLSLWGEVA